MLLMFVVVRVYCFSMKDALTSMLNHVRASSQTTFRRGEVHHLASSIAQKNSWYFKETQY